MTRNVTAALRGALASPEDTILTKLEWARKSGDSEKQLRDVAGVLDVTGDSLDRSYVERWANALGVLELWRRLDQAHG